MLYVWIPTRAFFCFRTCRGMRSAQPFLFSETLWATKQSAHIITRRNSGINEDRHAYELAPREGFFSHHTGLASTHRGEFYCEFSSLGPALGLARCLVQSAQRRKMNVHDWVNGRHFYWDDTWKSDLGWSWWPQSRIGHSQSCLFWLSFSLFARIKSGVVPLVRDRAADAIHCLEQDI